MIGELIIGNFQRRFGTHLPQPRSQSAPVQVDDLSPNQLREKMDNNAVVKFSSFIEDLLNRNFDLLNRQSSEHTDPYTKCYDGSAYTLSYPICWFRSLCIMLFFDQSFRDGILLNSTTLATAARRPDSDPAARSTTTLATAASSTIGRDVPVLAILQRFLYGTANYYGVRMAEKLKRPSFWSSERNMKMALFWLRYDNDIKFSSEDLWLYFIALLNAYDRFWFPYNTINGGSGHTNAVRFFKDAFPNIAPDVGKRCLVYTAKSNNAITLNLTPKLTEPEQPLYVVLNYNNFFTINANSKLAMFVRVNGNVYTLSSLMMTTYITFKWLITLPWCGHQFGIYKCNRKYYSFEGTYGAGSDAVQEVPLIQYLFVNGMMDDIVFRQYEYDLNRSIRVGLYTRSLFIFSEEEITLLEQLSNALKNTQLIPIMAALTYFTKSITVEFNQKQPKTTKIKGVAPTFAYKLKFWNHIDRTGGNLSLMFFLMNQQPGSERQTIGIINYPTEKQPSRIADNWQTAMSSHENGTELRTIYNWMLNIKKGGGIIKIHSFTSRNMIQEDTLMGIFKGLNVFAEKTNAASGNAVGGSSKTYIRMKKTKKSYKVSKDTQGHRYIMQNKHKVYLSEIRGSYLWM